MAEFSDESTVDVGMTYEPTSMLSCADIANFAKAMNDAKKSRIVQKMGREGKIERLVQYTTTTRMSVSLRCIAEFEIVL